MILKTQHYKPKLPKAILIRLEFGILTSFEYIWTNNNFQCCFLHIFYMIFEPVGLLPDPPEIIIWTNLNLLYIRKLMLITGYLVLEKILNFITISSLFLNCLPLKAELAHHLNKLESPSPRMLCTMFVRKGLVWEYIMF